MFYEEEVLNAVGGGGPAGLGGLGLANVTISLLARLVIPPIMVVLHEN